MTVLHLGVADFPYVNDDQHTEEPVRKGKRRNGSRWRRSDVIGGSVSTTGDVAEILEAKYHPMEIFAELHMEDVIVPALMNSVEGAIETLLMGGQGNAEVSPFSGAMPVIETAFRTFLDNREMEALGYPGVPTAAAIRGVNHRLKHPYAKGNSRRPSFIDTGTYQGAFRAWVD